MMFIYLNALFDGEGCIDITIYSNLYNNVKGAICNAPLYEYNVYKEYDFGLSFISNYKWKVYASLKYSRV
jgi:hypothetical protein